MQFFVLISPPKQSTKHSTLEFLNVCSSVFLDNKQIFGFLWICSMTFLFVKWILIKIEKLLLGCYLICIYLFYSQGKKSSRKSHFASSKDTKQYKFSTNRPLRNWFPLMFPGMVEMKCVRMWVLWRWQLSLQISDFSSPTFHGISPVT
jgi:hypothetical protein